MDDNRVGLHLSFYPKARGLLSSTFNRFALLAPASKSILKSCKSPAWLAWLQVELASWLGKKSQKTSLAQLLISFAVPWTKLSLPTYLCSLGPTKSLNPKSKTPTCCYNVKKKGKQQVQNITKPSGDNSLYRLLLKQDESFLRWSV